MLWKEKHREPGLFSLGKRWLRGPPQQSVPTQKLPEKNRTRLLAVLPGERAQEAPAWAGLIQLISQMKNAGLQYPAPTPTPSPQRVPPKTFNS